jgi:hypothetical protein
MTNAAPARTAADEARIIAAGKLIGSLTNGDRIRFTFNGAQVIGAYRGFTMIRQGRRPVGAEVLVQVGTERHAYHLQYVHDLERAPELTEACTAFVLDPATADRKLRRCRCGLSERMH